MKKLALALLFLAACRAKPPPASAQSAGPLAPLPRGRFGAASIRGRVVFEGTLPPAPRPGLDSFPECLRRDQGREGDPTLVVGADGALANAFVWVKDGLAPASWPKPDAPVTLEQQGCEFSPRVFGVRVGQPVELVNGDALLHDVHAFQDSRTAFNVAMPMKGLRVTKSFERAQVMSEVACDVHAWMRAFAGVVPHPFFAVTGADGRFALDKLPAGTYGVELWHERLGRVTRTVTVKDGEAAELDVELAAPRGP